MDATKVTGACLARSSHFPYSVNLCICLQYLAGKGQEAGNAKNEDVEQ